MVCLLRGCGPCLIGVGGSGSGEGLFEVGPEVGEVFAAKAQADVVGLHAGGNLLFRGQLAVRGACGVDGQALGVADVGQVAEEFEAVDGPLGSVEAGFYAKAEQAAVATGQIFVGRSVILGARQAGVVDPGNLGVVFEEMGGGQGVGADALHAQVQGLDAEEGLPGVEGGDAAADVAQELEAHFHGVGDVGAACGGEGFEGVPMHQPVVGGIGGGETGEASGAPVEIAAVHDDAADGGAVTGEVFGGGVDDDVCAPFEGAVEDGREAGVVENQRHVRGAGDGGDFFDGEDVEGGVAQAFAVKGFGVWAEGAAEGFGVIGIHEGDFEAEFGEGVVKQVVGAAVELGDGDDVVAGTGEVEDGVGDGGLAGGVGEGGGAALKRGDAALKHIRSGVHDTGVDVAQLFQGEEIRGVFGIAEDVTGRLVKGDGAGAGGGVGGLAGVEGLGAQAGGIGFEGGHRGGEVEGAAGVGRVLNRRSGQAAPGIHPGGKPKAELASKSAKRRKNGTMRERRGHVLRGEKMSSGG